MTYQFRSKASGDVLMLGPAGDAVLAAMGLAPAPQGIIEVAAMPGLIRALETRIASESATGQPAPEAADAAAGDDDVVTLRQRAWPLLEMLKRSLAAGDVIVWGV